jgi:hypothetical protein
MLRFYAFLIPVTAVMIEWLAIGGRLPRRVAMHFGPDGLPTGTVPFTHAFLLQFALVVGMGAVFTVGVPLLVGLAPGLVNIPNRDYWLASERREVGAAKVATWLAGFWFVFGTGIVAIFTLAMSANIGPRPHVLPTVPFLAMLAGLIAFAIGWAVAMIRAFRIPSAG